MYLYQILLVWLFEGDGMEGGMQHMCDTREIYKKLLLRLLFFLDILTLEN
jgi:hypothetical protein